MISMNLIRRAVGLTAVTAMAALVTVAASACGSAATSAGATTNGLEKKPAAEVLRQATAALKAAKSVHVVATSPGSGHVDVHMQSGSSTGTLTLGGGAQAKFMIIGSADYANADQAGLKQMGAPQQVQRHDAGRWLKVPAQSFTGLTLAALASQLTQVHGPLEPKVRQATLNGRKVVVVSWRNGSKLYVANTGPAYPLRAEYTGQNAARVEFTEYGAPLHITAPSNAIDLSNGR
jgi:hypothetical protein